MLKTAPVQSSLSPGLALLLIITAAQLLFSVGLQHPLNPYFDEVHYVPAARALIAGEAYLNPEHPLLAKYLIGLGMALFGDQPIGWRIFGTVAGTATVAAVFLIAQSLFRDVRLSATAAVLTMLNQLVFVQARIAMLDVYMGAFLMLGLWLLIDAAERQAGVRWRLLIAGALFGLAIGAKWAAAPYLALALVAVAGLRLRALREGVGRFMLSPRLAPWRGVSTLEAGVLLGGAAIAAYLLTFMPAFFLEQGRIGPADLLDHQLRILALQTQPLAQHDYASQWWRWPIMDQPIWYLYERVLGVQRGVLLIGNPAIMWGGLIAVAACLLAGVRDRAPRLLLIGALFLFSYGIWAVIPKKIGFYYYYYQPALFLGLALAAAFAHFCAERRRWWPAAFLALSAGLFVYFYPILAARPLADDQAFLRWMWVDAWR